MRKMKDFHTYHIQTTGDHPLIRIAIEENPTIVLTLAVDLIRAVISAIAITVTGTIIATIIATVIAIIVIVTGLIVSGVLLWRRMIIGVAMCLMPIIILVGDIKGTRNDDGGMMILMVSVAEQVMSLTGRTCLIITFRLDLDLLTKITKGDETMIQEAFDRKTHLTNVAEEMDTVPTTTFRDRTNTLILTLGIIPIQALLTSARDS
mmetsp:Transcript_46333/g.56147  ORF Transcript_46333/g.56147 Transcript_46333/m.56147 type:complete len:206 (+) Transcript_46333:884-1501(+)